MKLLLKIVGYSIAGIVGLVVLAFIVLQVISDEQYKTWITGAAQSATGRSLSIDGEFELKIGTSIDLAAHDISFANAEWGTRPEMVTADRLFVQLKLLPLVKGVLDFAVEVDTPDILIETNTEGTGNWVFDTAREAVEQPGQEITDSEAEGGSLALPVKPYIRNLEIKDLVFAFNDSVNETTHEAAVEQLRIFVDGSDIPLTLKAAYQGAPVELGGSLGNIEQWHNNQETPVSLKGRLNEAAISIDGSAGPLLPRPKTRLDIAVTADNVSTFGGFAGMELPSLQGLDVSLTLAAADGLLATEDVKLTLNDPRLLASIIGRVTDLGALSGIDLKAEINTEKGTELFEGLNLEIPYTLPQTISLKGGINGSIDKLSVEGLELIVKDQGLDVSLTAALEDILGNGSGTADLALSLESTSVIGKYTGQELPQFGPFVGSAKLSSKGDNFQLDALQLELQDPAVAARVEGSAEKIGRLADDSFEVAGIEVSADLGSEQLKQIVERLGVEVPGELPASFNLSLLSAGSLEKLGITDLQAVVKDAGIDISLNGTVDNVMDLSGVAAQLQAVVGDTASLSKFAGMDLPALGSLNLQSKLVSAEKTYRIEGLELVLDGDTVSATVTGGVKDLLALAKVAEDPDGYGAAGIDASVDIETGSLVELGKLVDVEMPDLGSVSLQGHFGSSDKSLALDNLKILLSGDKVEASVSGAVEDVLAMSKIGEDRGNFGGAGLDVSMAAQTSSVSELVQLAGVEIPEIGALQLDGHIGSTEQSLKLDTLKASLSTEDYKTHVEVVIEDVMKLAGIRAVVDGDLNSLASLSELVQKELPETGPWVVHVQADSEDPKESPVTFMVKLEGEGIDGVIDATLPDVKAPQTFQTELAIDVESLTRLGALFGKTIPEDKPIKIVGKASGKPGEYRLEEFTVREDQGEILANLAYITPPAASAERKTLTGELTINNFDFTDILATKKETSEAEAEESTTAEMEPVETKAEAVETEMVAEQDKEKQQAEETSTSGKRIFSAEPLAIGVLREYDVDLKLVAENVRIPNGIDMNGQVAVSLDDGHLKVDPIDLDQTNGGSGNGYLKLDARNEEAVLDVVLNFDEFVSPRFGGLFDLDMDLDGKGRSLADVMASLNGHFAAALKDIELEKSFMSQFGAGLLSNLNPLDSDKTMLECAVVRFDIEDGIADFNKKIAAQTSEVTWMGGGEINLKTEELDVGIAPKARGAISGLTNIGLASLVHVGGTLAEPKIGLDVADVAKKYAGYTAFVATGGLSFLAQKVVETAQANVDQCEKILGDLEEEETEPEKK